MIDQRDRLSSFYHGNITIEDREAHSCARLSLQSPGKGGRNRREYENILTSCQNLAGSRSGRPVGVGSFAKRT